MIAVLERPREASAAPAETRPEIGPNASLALREMLGAGEQYVTIRPVRVFVHPPFGTVGPAPLPPAIARHWQSRLASAMLRHYGHNGSEF